MIPKLLPFVIFLPLLGFLINGAIALFGRGEKGTARHPLVTAVGPGVVIGAFALAVALFMRMRVAFSDPVIVSLGDWMPMYEFNIAWTLQLDQLSMVMLLVITGVGSLIHLFSIGYMREDAGYARYFAYLNLFVAFMLVLVLGANYPVMFLGWEGVGLASYLLIGFWFGERANAEAGRKAFIVNRIGDFGLLMAMFLIYSANQHLDFVTAHYNVGQLVNNHPMSYMIAMFLLLGCVGKSAQIPLYIWLPDAMAGPTPVSALIHAATMVTAGVYMVTRASPIFAAAPNASLAVLAVGAVTALYAASIALRQWDIKKVLAYSTVSQLGYMFVAVGAGAYSAGVFHLVTHAFFKALLFLGAGSVIHAMHHAYHHTHRDAEDAQDMRNMGGLARFMPATAGAMTLATLAIAGVPPLAGFFSKDEILSSVFARAGGSALASGSLLGIPGSTVLYAAYGMGILTALLTTIYMTRLVLLTFFGSNRTGDAEQSALHEAPLIMTVPVLLLALLTLGGGWLNLPELLPWGRVGLLEHWLEPVVSVAATRLAPAKPVGHETELMLVGIATGTALLGIIIALVLYRKPLADKAHSPEDTSLLARAYGVDAAVQGGIVRPVSWIADTVLARGIDRLVDAIFSFIGRVLRGLASLFGSQVQDGDVGKYAWLLAGGAIVLIAALTLAVR
jgi:NADH-quinone oxidoreductase subunit L